MTDDRLTDVPNFTQIGRKVSERQPGHGTHCLIIMHVISGNSLSTHLSIIAAEGMKFGKEVSRKLILAANGPSGRRGPRALNKLHISCCLLRHGIDGILGLCSIVHLLICRNRNCKFLILLFLYNNFSITTKNLFSSLIPEVCTTYKQ